MTSPAKKTKDTCDKAIEILRLTHDGDDLDPVGLKLVENAVNGFLSEKGIDAFSALHEAVMKGLYVKPSFHGIKNLTIDHTGYVYWKGNVIEHYDFPWAYSQEGKKEAEELSRRCRIIERLGGVPSVGNVIWNWDEEAMAPCTQ